MVWRYQEVDVRDDVKWKLPDHSSLQVYKVLSGDSGKTYYVQVLVVKSELSRPQSKPIYLCGCPEGTFLAPLSIVGLGPQCKHAKNLAAFLEEKRKK